MVAGCWLLVAGTVVAGTNDVAVLPPVVVEASRIGDAAETMAASVAVFDADAIAASGARDVPELLAKSANVEIRQVNANPTQSQIAMRGFGENSFGRVKVLLDGEELNEIDMAAPDLSRIPIGSVRRIEIIPGPSPVLYGDGAVAGVVNIVTDDDSYERTTRLSARGGSQNTFGANVQTRGGLEDEGLTYSAAYDYVHSEGFRERSAYGIHALNAALKKHFANGSFVGLRANYGNALYEMPGALTWDEWQRDRTAAAYENDWCRVWNYGVGITTKAKLADDQWLYLDANYSQKHRCTNWGDYGYSNEYDLYGLFLAPRYVNEMQIGLFANKFTLGADFRYDRYEEGLGSLDGLGGLGGVDENRFGRMRYAGYANEEFFLTDELSFTAGARIECIDNRTSQTSQTSQTSVLGDYELAVVWRPADGLKTYAKGTRFHRSPFCDEMSYTEDGQMLEPETGWSLDVGAEWKFLKEFSAGLNGYGMLIDDEIFYDPYAKDYGGGAFGGYNCNSLARTRRIGFDAEFGWRRDKVAEASVKYGYVHADFADGAYGGCDVPLVPANRVRVEAGVWVFDDLEIKGGYRFVSSRALAGDFANAHDALDGYSLFDAGAYYEPRWAKGWRLAFVIDNIFDCDYCDYAGWSDWSGAYYYPACGRSFMFTLSYTF